MSLWHLIILFFILLLIFGPQRLEGIGVSLGRAVRGFKEGMEGEEKKTTTVVVEKTETNDSTKV